MFNVPGILNLPFQMFLKSENNGTFERALRVHYPQRIIFQLRNILKVWNAIMLLGTSVRKQHNLQILLPGYEKHSQMTNLVSQSQMTNN